jgi:stage VI sporulation protein D
VEELAVEIDNFDVDLITARSLNVTGVLALRGLQVQTPQVPIWRDDSFTVVHQAQPEQREETQRLQQVQNDTGLNETEELSIVDYASDGEEAEFNELEREDDWNLQSETEALTNDAAKESNWMAMFQQLQESRKEQETILESTSNPNPFASSLWGDVSNERFEEQTNSPEPEAEPTFEDKPDMRVALGGKSLESITRQQSGVGLLSQLGEIGAKREAELRILEAAQAEEKAQAASNSSLSSGDELEWTRLFLTNGTQAHTFRKVKMCIVQREETLDSIAMRYNVQSRELQLYNRLHDPYLSEGQILYIP